MTIPNTARKAGPLLGTGSQTAWPFTFKVFAAGDVQVTIANSTGTETLLVLGTDYTVTLNSNQDTSPGGTVNYPISGAALPVGSVLAIIGDLDYDQPLDLPSGGNFSPTALENQLDRSTMQIQQLREEMNRTAKLPPTSTDSVEALVDDLQRIADSADNLDTIAANIADVNTVANDLNEPVSEINTVATSITNVNTVGNNIANVNTVAGISANVTAVAGISANVTTVAGIAANVTAVAGNATNINTVAGNNANVTAVGANITNVNTVAANEVSIDTVAGIASNVSAVAAIDDAVSIAAANVADINNFADVYQGGKASDPTVRNDGSALQSGDLYFNTTLGRMRIRVFGVWDDAVSNAGSVVVESFSGTGSQTVFTLATNPLDKTNTQVFIAGVYQQKSEYSVLGTTLTFTAAPTSGTSNIEVVIATPVAFGNLSAIQADVTAKSAAAVASAAAALVSEGNADTSEAAALAAKTAAEAARDAALAAAKTYTTTAAGLAATTSGQVFLVTTANLQAYSVYQNSTGSAVLLGTLNIADGGAYDKAVAPGILFEQVDSFGRVVQSINDQGDMHIAQLGGKSLQSVIAPLVDGRFDAISDAVDSLSSIQTVASEIVGGTDILRLDFSKEEDAAFFTDGEWVAGAGDNFSAGYLSITGPATAQVDLGSLTGRNYIEISFMSVDTFFGLSGEGNCSIVLLPEDKAPLFANSVANLILSRGSGAVPAPNLNTFGVGVSASAESAITLPNCRKTGWHHVGFLIDVATRSFDVYFEGIKWKTGVLSRETTYTAIRRLVLTNNPSAPEIRIGKLIVKKLAAHVAGPQWIFDDFTIGSGLLSNSTPAVSKRELFPQKWIAPNFSGLSGFTRSASGLVPGAGTTFNVLNGPSQGTWKMRWKAPASGAIYAGIAFNCYEVTGSGLGTEDAYYLMRYHSAATAGQKLRLTKGSTVLGSSDGTAGGVTYAAESVNEFMVRRQGRQLQAYVNGQLQFSVEDSTPVRGLIGEEGFGPIVAASLGTSSILSISASGPAPQIAAPFVHGGLTSVVKTGNVREMYVGASTENLFYGKGIQNAHRSQAEPAEGYAASRNVLLQMPNVQLEHQRGLFVDEGGSRGIAEVFYARTRRGVACGDRAEIWGNSNNWGPDLDLHPAIFRAAGGRAYAFDGTVTAWAWTTQHDWTYRVIGDFPYAAQFIGALADSSRVRLTLAFRNNLNLPSGMDGASKHKGNGDGLSFDVSIPYPTPITDTTYEMGILYLVETGDAALTFDNDVANGWRSYHSAPTIPTFSSGTVITSATGDLDADGYNERFGWIELLADQFGGFKCSLTLAGTFKLPRFQFRVYNWTGAETVVINGAIDNLAVVDDMGDGSALLTLGDTLSGTSTIELV